MILRDHLTKPVCTALTLLAVLAPTALTAALPPCAQDREIRTATDVVQIKVTRVDVPPEVGQEGATVMCPVRGEVVRSFRGGFTVGDEIDFTVLCYTRMVGGAYITSPDALLDARVIEAHLIEGQPVWNGPSVQILAEATDEIAWKPFCKE